MDTRRFTNTREALSTKGYDVWLVRDGENLPK